MSRCTARQEKPGWTLVQPAFNEGMQDVRIPLNIGLVNGGSND